MEENVHCMVANAPLGTASQSVYVVPLFQVLTYSLNANERVEVQGTSIVVVGNSIGSQQVSTVSEMGDRIYETVL